MERSSEDAPPYQEPAWTALTPADWLTYVARAVRAGRLRVAAPLDRALGPVEEAELRRCVAALAEQGRCAIHELHFPLVEDRTVAVLRLRAARRAGGCCGLASV